MWWNNKLMLGRGLFSMSMEDEVNFRYDNADDSYMNIINKLKNYSNKYQDNKEFKGLTSVFVDVHLSNQLETTFKLIPIIKK